jgi:hypothetical protein
MQCAICRSSAFSRLWPLQTRAPQQHNRTVLAFAEFKVKAAGGVGLTCRVVILVPAFGPATMGSCVATIVVPPVSPLDGARRARILSGNIINQPGSRGSAVGCCPRRSPKPHRQQFHFAGSDGTRRTLQGRHARRRWQPSARVGGENSRGHTARESPFRRGDSGAVVEHN